MGAAIVEVEAVPVLYPVAGDFKFFENAGGRPRGRPAVLVRIVASDGTVGWGESVPSPRWSYETLESVLGTIRGYLAPELIGQDPFDVDALHRRMNAAIAPSFSTGQPICKAGLDLAVFDLNGKLAQRTARERWGRNDRTLIDLSWTLNPQSLVDVDGRVDEAVRRGYRHFNVKVGPDPAYDVELVKRIRSLAPSAGLWVDANGGYEEADALAAAPQFADLGVSFFEQPCPANRLSSFARLKRQGALPILMDEGLVSVVELEQFHRLGLLDGAAIKVSRWWSRRGPPTDRVPGAERPDLRGKRADRPRCFTGGHGGAVRGLRSADAGGAQRSAVSDEERVASAARGRRGTDYCSGRPGAGH